MGVKGGEGFDWRRAEKQRTFNSGERCEHCEALLSIYNDLTVCEKCRKAGMIGQPRDGKKRHPLHMGVKRSNHN